MMSLRQEAGRKTDADGLPARRSVDPMGFLQSFRELGFHYEEPVRVGDFFRCYEVSDERQIGVRCVGDANRWLGDGEVFADAAGESSIMEVGRTEACVSGCFGEKGHRRDAALGIEMGAQEFADANAGALEVRHGLKELIGRNGLRAFGFAHGS
jgi:hypothetical protein